MTSLTNHRDPTNRQSLIPHPYFACLFGPRGGSTDALLAVARAFSPRYERHGDDLIVLDVSGLTRMFGDARAIGEAIRRDAGQRGLVVHIALAGTSMAAQLVARVHPGVTIVEPGREAAALAPLPISLAPGLHPSNLPNLFKSWGIRTLGQLAALPAADLAARIGPAAARWQALARGEELAPLVPEAPEERFDASLDLDWPIEGLEPLSFVLTRLLEPLTTMLERRDRAVAVLHVRFVLTTSVATVRSLRVASPVRDVRTLRGLVLLDLESHPLDAAVDRVELLVDPTPGKVLQHTLFERPHPTPEQISTLLARLGALMGQNRVGAAMTLDTYRPGAFAMREFGSGRLDGLDRSAPAATPISMLRRCRQPVPARVVVNAGRPVRVTTDRQGFAGGAVLSAAGPWRASGEWWELEGSKLDRLGRVDGLEKSTRPTLPTHPTHPTPYDRTEWDVALADGGVYRIFQDHDLGRWFIEGIVD